MLETEKPDFAATYHAPGAQVSINGLWYKIGLQGMAFVHNGIEWVKSNRPIYEVKRAIENTQRLSAMAQAGKKA